MADDPNKEEKNDFVTIQEAVAKDREEAEKKRKRQQGNGIRGVMIFLGFLAVLVCCYEIYAWKNEFVFTERLSEPILIINDETIDLQEISYYIMKVERQGGDYADIYDSEHANRYWNLYMNKGDGENSGYVSGIAKDTILTYCIRDHIYAMEAEKNGFTIPEEIREEIIYDAKETFANLSRREQEMFQWEEEEFVELVLSEQLAYYYMAQLAEGYDRGTLQAMVLQYDVGGEYYENLKASYRIWVNEKIWKRVKVGFLTIN
ncbi:MAG: hypothetical protein ACI4DU_06485 [Lachnospiraceae bacterium]